jgi:membrane-associated protein
MLLFLIIFLEAGLFIFPYLPGDSLLFITGTLAATGVLTIEPVLILGNYVNNSAECRQNNK